MSKTKIDIRKRESYHKSLHNFKIKKKKKQKKNKTKQKKTKQNKTEIKKE